MPGTSRLVASVLAVLAAGCAASTTHTTDAVATGAYELAVDPVDVGFGEFLRFDLAIDGHFDGHHTHNYLRCRDALARTEWDELTGLVNAVDLTHDIPMCRFLDFPLYSIRVTPTTGIAHEIRWSSDCMQPELVALRDFLDRRLLASDAAGFCGPDEYAY